MRKENISLVALSVCKFGEICYPEAPLISYQPSHSSFMGCVHLWGVVLKMSCLKVELFVIYL